MENGVDTGKQIEAENFAGRYPHNSNLSVKGILGIASYGLLAEFLGKEQDSQKYLTAAREMAREWETLAFDGDHYRLSFDRQGSWSLKYNLIWDKLLQLNVFSEKVVRLETSYYMRMLDVYGCPLSNDTDYARTDCSVWVAALNKDRRLFSQFINSIYKYMNETKIRVPMADTYNTLNQKTRVTTWGRAVSGAYFIKLLEMKMATNQ